MRKLLLLLATILCSVSSFADNYLSMDPIRMKAGETKQVSINLTNDVSITAFQMDLYLPAGVTIDKDADDEYLIDLATRTTTKKHTVTEAIQTDGAMRIVVYSNSNKVFTGTEGAILNLTLKADASIALGSYTVKIDNVVMSELENSVVTELKPAAKTTTLAIVADYAITSSAATAGGTVTGSGTYSSDQDVTLTATPETGYHFVSWSNGSTANPLVFKPTKSEEINATFAPNKYAVKYEVDGTVVHTDSVNYGAAVTAWSNPTKEGYTFSGWSTIPTTMPANDVTVTGSFTVNSYSLIYMVDGAEYKKVSVTYGATITPEAVPTKEGYTFSGWSTIPTTMPAKDVTVTGTFAVNTYKVTFTIDGTILATKDVTFGSAITPPDAPAKEGYTFAGWSTIPTTMPAKDITITGSYTVNSYSLIYMVDGTEYKKVSVTYGATITPEAVPTKEGYTFSGWSTIPTTMPAKDVTITGTFAVNSYSLIYMVDGTEYKKVSVAYGTTITPEAAPTKEGYTFSGWSTVPSTMPAKDVTVTGTFSINTYKVTFTIEGTTIATKDVTFGSAITAPDAPAKEGYTFAGWSTIPSTMPAKDITITGSYTVNTYKVTFNIDGTTIATRNVAFGGTITAPDAPAKEGYTFAGWSTIPTTMPAKDITITGSYTVNSYSLIYMVDGAQYKKVSVAYGATITPEAVPTKEGYTFSGWSTIPTTMPAKDVTVTGTFAVNTYKVSFSFDAPTIATMAVRLGSAFRRPDAPAKEGYTFAGWSTIPSTMPAKDITITGSYTVNSYSLIYIVDGLEYKKVSVLFGTAITAMAGPTKEGYTFTGWSNLPTTMPAKDVTATATFKVNSYSVTFKLDGEVFAVKTYDYGTTLTPIEVPAKEGYKFSGWQGLPTTMPAKNIEVTGSYIAGGYNLVYMVDGKEYRTYVVSYGAAITPEAVPTKEGYTFSGWSTIPSTMPAKDVTVTGTFTVNTYKVTFSIDGVTIATKDVTFGGTITTPDAPAKEGYTFAGWSAIPTTMPAKDITITGSYTVNSYSLVYMLDGKEYKKVSVAYGAAITPEAAPTKEGYTFSGWSTIPSTMPAKDVTVTGTFTVNKYTVTFTIYDETIATEEVAFGDKIPFPEAPAKEGRTFSGWGNVPTTMPAKNLTFSGSYTINKYNLTYMVDGEEYKTSSVEYGAAITPEAAPTKEGYTFSGWSTIPSTMPAKDVTVTGTFKVNYYNITYMVDGEVYKVVSTAYGTAITLIDAPVKTGYQFSGWSTAPATMPANDIEITGNFVATGIAGIQGDVYVDVYSVEGKVVKVHALASELKNELTPGLYIINGKKVLIRRQ